MKAWCLAIFGWWMAVAGGTDVAFWQEYDPRAEGEVTYLLAPMTDADTIVGPVAGAELRGDAALVAEGRFGGGLRVRGNGAMVCTMETVFAGGYVSIEAWVKLEAYPEQEGWIVYRPARVDKSPKYDPAVDTTKGFGLAVDWAGALHLETVNTYYGKRVRTSSAAAGVVPVGEWVHVAATSATFPVSFRRLFVNGVEVAAKPIAWGEGIQVSNEVESVPSPIFIGGNEAGEGGLNGWIDQVRVHRNLVRFWPLDVAWTAATAGREIPEGPPFFVAGHQPTAALALDGELTATGATAEGKGDFVEGVRGQAFAGVLSLRGESLLNLREGTIEFWMRPMGFNNLSDKNRTILNGPFALYVFNGGNQELTAYFRDREGSLTFLHDKTVTALHPGAWYHVVIAWKQLGMTLYLNGRQVGRLPAASLKDALGRDVEGGLTFNPSGINAAIDEVRLYREALTETEVGNAYWRYRDPARLVGGVTEPAIEIVGEYLPSHSQIVYQFLPNIDAATIASVQVALQGERAGAVLTEKVAWTDQAVTLPLPPLAEDDYALTSEVVLKDGTSLPGGALRFVRQRFPWEGNTLGISDRVYAPFVPIGVEGEAATVIGRHYVPNGFGLFDQVSSLGRPLLAAPMTVRGVNWQSASGRWTQTTPKEAVWEATASAAAVRLTARCTLSIDGCWRVDLEMAPGAAPAPIDKLWIEIPLLASEATLMHTIGDGLRHNYAGETPAGEGVVWDGSQVARSPAWRNQFVPYIWLGGAERGLAWFAENDAGWITEKGKSTTPTHELVRDGDRLTLRIYLVNMRASIDGRRHLVFGMQASPTKPLPADWRQRLPSAPGGLAVVPWGGLNCASQGPYGDDWEIVDKIVAARHGEPTPKSWFETYAKEHAMPLVHGTWDWVSSVQHFAGVAQRTGLDKPVAVYQEEMMAATTRPEWIVFQDEWKIGDGPGDRALVPLAELAPGHRTLSSPARVTFPASYRDFGVWMANEWLSRGISLYWDNTYPKLATNTRTTAAYVGEDGAIQPCWVIWNQRAYMERVWHLLQAWRERRLEPLEWTLHMTNTQVLPLMTWGTVALDHELGTDRPFSPAWLRTETTGRQTGNLPLSHYPVAGKDNETWLALPAARRELVEWGMRAVHEIQRSGGDEQRLLDSGYGTPRVTVHNYWEDEPVLTVDREDVKWLALVNEAENLTIVVLASWALEPVRVTIASPRHPGHHVVDLEGPWGVRIVELGGLAPHPLP